MSNIPYDDWRSVAAREIMDAISTSHRMQAYYDAGGGDGWARQYGAQKVYPDHVAGIIDRHYQQRDKQKVTS